MSDAHPSQFGFGDRFFDRLRLQFLGSGNWKFALSDSNLPDEVTTLIGDVVQQTGLLRFEKSEITTELIHHFQDGHDRGHPFDELVRDFGKADVAVSLFRSSKLRSRPMSVKAFRGSFAVFGGGLISYLLLQLFFHAAKPNPSVDYAEKLNETVTSMPEEQKAWPLYRDVWTKYGLSEGGFENFSEIYVHEEKNSYSRLIRPTDEKWDAAVEKLKSLEELLAVLRKGSKLPYLGTPLHVDLLKYSDEDLAALFPGMDREKLKSESGESLPSLGLGDGTISEEADLLLGGSTIGILLPHIQQFREVARLLHVDTRLAVQTRDPERAIDNIRTTFGLARQAGDNPIIVCGLVGVAVRSMGMLVVEELMVEHPDFFNDEQLEVIQQLVANLDFENAVDITSERLLVMDIIQRTYSDDGDGNGRMTAVGSEVLFAMSRMWNMSKEEDDWTTSSPVRKLTGPMQLFTAPSRKQIVSLFDETMAKANEHCQTKMWEDSDFDLDKYLDDRDPSGFIKSLGLISLQLKSSREIRIAQQDAVLLALAMHRFKRANDQWPTTLDQLIGKWIDRTPIDRLSGKPLSFVVNEHGPVVYSKGHDGDDDGGKTLDLTEPEYLDKDGDGDWILWPTNDD